MRKLAYLLFAGGLLLAVLCAAKMPDEEAAFPNTWPGCILGASVAMVGLVLWRRDDRAQRESPGGSRASSVDRLNPNACIAAIADATSALSANFPQQSLDDLLAQVDTLIQTHVLPLEAGRHRVIQNFGLKAGAEILVAAAVGERMLNRTWSAAADGYPEEAKRSLVEANAAFVEAKRLLDQAAKAN